MIRRVSHRTRAAIAIAIFTVSSGGTQLTDALLFHNHVERPTVARWNDGDHCHAESCDLGIPIVPAPALDRAMGDGRIEPGTRTTPLRIPADVPIAALATGPVGPRAPPLHS